MGEPKFCLSWDAYQTSICRGLSALQQNGEFVDMTLAADGHYVKVHQMVMSLVSPYIKELIAAANCQHPVIFLNHMSYETLCSILEYIYTGEVHLTKDNIAKLLQAAKALHINGLADMPGANDLGKQLRDELSNKESRDKASLSHTRPANSTYCNTDPSVVIEDDPFQQVDDTFDDSDDTLMDLQSNETIQQSATNPVLQYTLSNQGGLQLILNRFIYFLRYSGKKEANAFKRWQCTEYTKRKCPAYLVTRGDAVINRVGSHNHTFHDDKILKRIRNNLIYSAAVDAELEATKKRDKSDSKATEISVNPLSSEKAHSSTEATIHEEIEG